MVLHPHVDVGDEAVLGGEAKQLTPGYAIRDPNANVGVQPARHQLPREFVGDLEVLYDAGADPCRSTSLNCPMRASFSLTANRSVSVLMEFLRLSSWSGMAFLVTHCLRWIPLTTWPMPASIFFNV